MELRRRKSSPTQMRYWIFVIVVILFILSLVYSNNLQNRINSMRGTPITLNGTINAMNTSEDGSLLYLGMRDNKIIALDKNNNEIWEFKAGGGIVDLKASGNFLYASADDRKLYILDSKGKLIKDIQVSYRPIAVAGSKAGDRIVASTSMSAMKNRLQLYDDAGKQLWTQDPGQVVENVFMIPESDKIIYVMRNAQIVLADANGKGILKNKVVYHPLASAYSYAQKLIVVADEGNNLYAFDDGLKQLWSAKLNSKITALDIDNVNDQVVVATSDGLIIMVDLKGNERARISVGGEIRSIKANKATGELFTLSGNNGLMKYTAAALSDYAGVQRMIGFSRVSNIILLILLVVSTINLSPKMSAAVWSSLGDVLKVLYRHKLSYLLLLPTLVLLGIFSYYPAISGLILAFTDYKPGIYMHWVGLDNFVTMVQNPYFWIGVGNMLIFLGTDLLKALIPPIIFAELIIAMRSKAGQYWTRVALYLPGILPGIAGLLVWTNGILGNDGLINGLLRAVGLGGWARSWLGDPQSAIWALVFIGFPWIGSYIIFYGALINLPNSLFDAAKIDGCGWWRRILSIDVPLISPQIKYVFVVSFIGSVQDFGRVYMTTMGGPGHATYIPMLELFYQMSKFQQYGEAAAMGLFLFIVIFGATLMNLRIRTTAETMQ